MTVKRIADRRNRHKAKDLSIGDCFMLRGELCMRIGRPVDTRHPWWAVALSDGTVFEVSEEECTPVFLSIEIHDH